MRPTREEGDEYETGESSPEIITGERAMSPEQNRAKSPTAFSSNRAASPIMSQSGEVYEPLSMASAAMGLQNAARSVSPAQNAARSASPAVDERSRSPLDGHYGPNPSSPTMNGFGHGRTAGSTGNLTANLIRDLKEKEAEMEAMKKREAWMKAALAKASRSGFVYVDEDGLGTDAENDDDIDSRRVAEMVINLKHVKAKIQVTIRIYGFRVGS